MSFDHLESAENVVTRHISQNTSITKKAPACKRSIDGGQPTFPACRSPKPDPGEISGVFTCGRGTVQVTDRCVLTLLLTVLATARSALRTHAALALENLALRQQLAVLQRRRPRPPLVWTDRLLWVGLSRVWSRWRGALVIVKPATVVRWHRSAFRRFWTWRSRRPPGRPPIERRTRELVRQMAHANPLWGAPRIHGELVKLGITISEREVSRLIPRVPRKPPSQTWRTFLNNHVGSLASIDFFTVPTATFRVLYVFVVLAQDRRRVLHFNVTDHPTATWTAQQVVEAFPELSAPKYLLRDRDGIYGAAFRDRLAAMGIEQVVSAPRSPWQNPFVERLIGSIRRECLDHVIVLGEHHLRRILASYFAYYHRSRTHLSLNKDAPEPRAVMSPENGEIVALPEVGGLHHRYERHAA
jgi:putative transposase